jgi:hypothetical protein
MNCEFYDLNEITMMRRIEVAEPESSDYNSELVGLKYEGDDGTEVICFTHRLAAEALVVLWNEAIDEDEHLSNRVRDEKSYLDAADSEITRLEDKHNQLERWYKSMSKDRNNLYDLLRAILDATPYAEDTDELRAAREELWNERDESERRQYLGITDADIKAEGGEIDEHEEG